jgi:type IV secretory pathway VirB3-like protein
MKSEFYCEVIILKNVIAIWNKSFLILAIFLLFHEILDAPSSY